jgi:predicted phosphoribosyltransferase
LIRHLCLSEKEVEQGVARTRQKVERRCQTLRGDRPLPRLSGRHVVLIDDGLASGFTMMVAVEAVRDAGADPVFVAVPTGHFDSVRRIASVADQVACANLRSGSSFAVASAYEQWSDVSEEEAASALATVRSSP